MKSNFRRLMVSLSLLIGVAAPWAAIAQAPIINIGSGSTDDRLVQLERISNAHGQLLTQLQQQVMDNQRDIDTLRGQIQESQYLLNQLTERQRELFSQLDTLSGGTSNGASTDSGSSAGGDSASAAVPADTSAPDAAASKGNEKDDYNAAVNMAMNTKDYDGAIGAFQSFIKSYPKSSYLPNANYWLGQMNYNKGKKDDAVAYFASVVKNWPKSQKAGESFYKVGLIMQEKGDKAKAKAIYQQVIAKYPGSTGAKLAEKKLSGL